VLESLRFAVLFKRMDYVVNNSIKYIKIKSMQINNIANIKC
jgi:hypothetical protein